MKQIVLLIGAVFTLCLASIYIHKQADQDNETLTLQNIEALAFDDFENGKLPVGWMEGMSAAFHEEPVLTPNGWEWQDVPCCQISKRL